MKINNDDLGLGTHHINNNMKVNNDDLGLRTKHINNNMKINNDDLGVGTLSIYSYGQKPFLHKISVCSG